MGHDTTYRLGTISAAVLMIAATGVVGCDDLFDNSGPSIRGEDGESADTVPSDAAPEDGTSGETGGDDTGGEGDTGGADTEDAFSCDGSICGGSCCPADRECVRDQCLAACSGTRCGDEQTKCCTGDELCIGDGCAQPHGDCERTEDCAKGQICQPSVGKCISRDNVEVCEYRPPTGEFTPEIDCNWSPADDDPHPNRGETEAAPTVANVTDDNGDGNTNTEDIPDLIFLSDDHGPGCCNRPSTIRIVHGECNEDGTMTTLGSISDPVAESSGGIAVGDLTGDGVPEIVAPTRINSREQGVAAWSRESSDGSDWSTLWHNKQYPTRNHTNGGSTVSLADLNADGNPEVVIGNIAINGQTGDLLWDGLDKTGGDGGVGNNAFLGPSSSVADIDLDGMREVAAGNTLYDHDGTELWTYEFQEVNSGCQGSLPCDGFTGMADFDDDPEGEVVIVRRGIVYIVGHEGDLQWKHPILKDDCSRGNESGPPTVADFDGDGDPEIGTAAADFYTVLDPDCDPEQGDVPDQCRQRGILWATPNEDCSSRATASSVFDFEGDGRAEMVYADEETFYILDGKTGDILHRDDDHGHNTRVELPLVADIDNDGNSEVVIGAPYGPNAGITVWGDQEDNWVRTRRIWNQHAYSVTNVEEDGTIPTQATPNWQNDRLNNFRQNQQPAGVFDAPDLVAASIEASDVSCVGERTASLEVTVENQGALGVEGGIPVELVAEKGGMTRQIARWTTSDRLLPGQQEVFATDWTVPDGWLDDGFTVHARVDVDDEVNECDEDNNATTIDSDDAIELKTAPVEIASLSADGSKCREDGTIGVEFTVENTGDEPAPKDVPIRVLATQGAQEYVIETVETSSELAPGAMESFSMDWEVETRLAGESFDVEVLVDPDQSIFNCDETNRKSTETQCNLGG